MIVVRMQKYEIISLGVRAAICFKLPYNCCFWYPPASSSGNFRIMIHRFP